MQCVSTSASPAARAARPPRAARGRCVAPAAASPAAAAAGRPRAAPRALRLACRAADGKSVAVVGGTGRIGSAAAAALLAAGHRLTLVGRSRANFDAAVARRPELAAARFAAADIGDKAALAAALGGADLVVHAAGARAPPLRPLPLPFPLTHAPAPQPRPARAATALERTAARASRPSGGRVRTR